MTNLTRGIGGNGRIGIFNDWEKLLATIHHLKEAFSQ